MWRDLSGQTGWKRLRYTLRGDLGMTPGKGQKTGRKGMRTLYGTLVTNAVLLGILTLAGHPALYLLWVVAWFTTYSLVTRIRSIAEHAIISDPADELQNTRTTVARWWERLLIAPNHVNYHLEHHLLFFVPCYNLPKLHRLLMAGPHGGGMEVRSGYREVLRMATARADEEDRPGELVSNARRRRSNAKVGEDQAAAGF